MSQISDLKPILDGIATDVTGISGDVGTVSSGVTDIQAKLAALQNSKTSTLSPDDQAALDAVVKQAGDVKTSLDAVKTSLDTVVTGLTTASSSAPSA